MLWEWHLQKVSMATFFLSHAVDETRGGWRGMGVMMQMEAAWPAWHAGVQHSRHELTGGTRQPNLHIHFNRIKPIPSGRM